jgi:hypothetical protein
MVGVRVTRGLVRDQWRKNGSGQCSSDRPGDAAAKWQRVDPRGHDISPENAAILLQRLTYYSSRQRGLGGLSDTEQNPYFLFGRC